jgi:hypothetical protein
LGISRNLSENKTADRENGKQDERATTKQGDEKGNGAAGLRNKISRWHVVVPPDGTDDCELLLA